MQEKEPEDIDMASSLLNGLFMRRFTDEQLIAAAKNPKTPVVTPVVTLVVTPDATPVVKPSETLINEIQWKILRVLHEELLPASELTTKIGICSVNNVRRRYLRLLLDMGLVEYTIPNKPNSKNQQYRLTSKGHELIDRQDSTHDASEVVNGGLNGARGGLDGGLNANRGGLNGGINEMLIKAIQEHPGKRVLFYKGLLSAGSRTIERALSMLIATGQVEHRGSKKTGGYYAI